jgi:Zn-dependent protease
LFVRLRNVDSFGALERIASMQLQAAFPLGIAAMIIHEAGHVAVALMLKVKVHQVGIRWRGLFIRRESGTTVQNLAVSLAGSGVNLWLALLFHSISHDFALCNLVVGVTNLLPISGSDGLRVLNLIGNLVHPPVAPETTNRRHATSSAQLK